MCVKTPKQQCCGTVTAPQQALEGSAWSPDVVGSSWARPLGGQPPDIHPDIRTMVYHRRPLSPSTAPGRARAARGQQCGTIYWQTGRVCLQPGGLPCGSRPPPQIKGSKRLDAASTDTKGQGKRPPHLTCSTNFSLWRLGAGYEGALSLIFVMPTVCDRATTRRVAWSR